MEKAKRLTLLQWQLTALSKPVLDAGAIIKEAATVCGGGGGGRPNMAQAGGKDASKIADAINKAIEVIKTQI